ncbi:LysR family transcriptional regulator [Paenibacillus oralis]|uniref:LysR family transcriptional regulator n=1 Tax=Paenibacillus oralis TaxID=2490856 RepID=A0A3P3UCA4_9BACL|nr:LysR family transcriptional regulator [Paenibacillus oralis]RRJ67306.1 LysR family transcriptional regulator [Paenibacillus oralis]
MELRHLRYFVAVAEELHFGRAASRLQMTQSPLSHQIKELEEELSAQLFHRTKRSVQLTNAGKVFLRGVYTVFEEIEAIVDAAQKVHRGEVGRLNIGFVGSAIYDILPAMLPVYRNKYPEVEVELKEMSTPEQIEALIHQEIDVGLLRPPINNPLLSSEIIQTLDCVLALPGSHPLAKAESIYPADLKNESFVLISKEIFPRLYSDFINICNSAGFRPDVKQEAKEYQTAIGLVSAGMGISVVPTTARTLQARDVVYREISSAILKIDMALAWRNSSRMDLIQRFVRLARDVVV